MKVVRITKTFRDGGDKLPRGRVLSTTDRTAERWIKDGVAKLEPQTYKSQKRKRNGNKTKSSSDGANAQQKGGKPAEGGADQPKNG